MTGCFFTDHPETRNKCWYCEELDMVVDYRESTLAQKTNYNYGITELTWNGERIKVDACFDAALFIWDPVVTRVDSQYYSCITGVWDYDGENIVCEVTDDDVFHGALEGMVFVFTVK
jgi:hypothetical protein